MTKKRDLKRRVRDRQAETGESYTAARRNVVGLPDEPPDEPPDESSESKVPVFELVDVSDQAAAIGFRCRILMFPSLVDAADPAVVLRSLFDVLVATAGNPQTGTMWMVAIGGFDVPARPTLPRSLSSVRRFLHVAQAGLGGTSEDGSMLAIHVGGKTGVVPVLCTHWSHKKALVLAIIDGDESELWPMSRLLGQPRDLLPLPWLFVLVDGKRHAITHDHFVIGSDLDGVALTLRDDAIAGQHAAVLHRDGRYYLKDLSSTLGIVYKGMQIDNKRIDEGDVFYLGDHELRFTFRSDTTF